MTSFAHIHRSRILLFGTLIYLACLTVYAVLFPDPRMDSVMRISLLSLLILASWTLASRVRRMPQGAERLFWAFYGAATGAWAVGILMLLTFNFEGSSRSVQIVAEICFAGGYACFALALAQQPHRHASFEETRLLRLPALIFFFLGILVYALLVPTGLGTWDDEPYSAAGLYLVVDALLALRIFQLWRLADAPRWRRIYGRLTVYAVLLMAGDLAYAVSAGLANMITSPAQLLLIATATLRLTDREDEETSRGALSVIRDPSWQTLTFAVSFPIAHTLLHRLGALAPAAQTIRADLALLWSVLLGALALLQHHRLELSRRELVEQRETLIGKLKAKTTELERYAYAVSHDLKSPLFTIEGLVRLLERDLSTEQTDRLAPHLRQMTIASQRMGRIIDDLLELSKIGGIPARKENVALVRIAHDAAQLVSGRIRRRGVKIDISADLPEVVGDPGQLLRLFQNLLDNAVKFMGRQKEPRIEIGVRGGDELVFYVRDNGIGIAHPDQKKIFGLFDRLDSKIDGTGVGLTLVQRIVALHGGRIWVESDGFGHGTTMAFTLPAMAGETVQPTDGFQ